MKAIAQVGTVLMRVNLVSGQIGGEFSVSEAVLVHAGSYGIIILNGMQAQTMSDLHQTNLPLTKAGSLMMIFTARIVIPINFYGRKSFLQPGNCKQIMVIEVILATGFSLPSYITSTSIGCYVDSTRGNASYINRDIVGQNATEILARTKTRNLASIQKDFYSLCSILCVLYGICNIDLRFLDYFTYDPSRPFGMHQHNQKCFS